jgi:Rab GTPase-activating protein 1
MPEEQAFNLLVKIMFNYQLREIYKTNFENLHTRFYQLEMLIQELLPELHDHFSDLNIETHMFASQWFLTLYTAKFPLHMVFRIIDLFLHDGINVLFSIGIALLKQSQKDLLSLDFEGVLKYFRVNLPKKYRNESSLKDLIQAWLQIRGKISDKKLKKYEKMHLTQKELDALKEDPLVRLEKQNKHLTNTVRRLELENDDLANEFIDNRMSLSKQLDEQRDLNEQLKLELARFKRDSHLLVNEHEDTIKKYSKELEALKNLWRTQSEKYEHEIERQQVIINEYKQICNKLSTKMEANNTCKILFEQFFMKFKSIKLCNDCNEKYASDLELNKLISTIIDLINDTNDVVSSSGDQSIQSISNSVSNSSIAINDQNSQIQSKDKIKQLELELARVKLELVDAQCKNQEYKHKFKQIQLQQTDSHETFKIPLPPNSLASSMSSLTSPGSRTNGWLTKTFSQFKEATNQVVQKVKNHDNN